MKETDNGNPRYPHLSLDADGVLIVTGTRTKVLMVVMDHVGQGWDAREIQRQHPYLTLGQIHRRWPTITTTRLRWTPKWSATSRKPTV